MSISDNLLRISDSLEAVAEGKENIAEAITAKGVDTLPEADFDTLALNIGRIEGGETLRSVTGTVVGTGALTTIEHDLGTKRIIGILYPVGAYRASANGQSIIKLFGCPAEIIGEPILCDFSAYNKVIDNPYTYSPENSFGLTMSGPSSTTTAPANARYTTSSSNQGETYDDNSVHIRSLSVGQLYRYHIFALD